MITNDPKSKFDLSESTQVFPNVLQSDKCILSFSNMPSMIGLKDLKYYNNMVKSVTVPDYNLSLYQDNFQAIEVSHPVSRINDNMSTLIVTFKVSEDALNYMNLINYIRELRYGDINTDKSDLISKYNVTSIDLNILDNQKRIIAVIRFKHAFCTSVSSLNFSFGDSEQLEFTTNWSFRTIEYKTESII